MQSARDARIGDRRSAEPRGLYAAGPGESDDDDRHTQGLVAVSECAGYPLQKVRTVVFDGCSGRMPVARLQDIHGEWLRNSRALEPPHRDQSGANSGDFTTIVCYAMRPPGITSQGASIRRAANAPRHLAIRPSWRQGRR